VSPACGAAQTRSPSRACRAASLRQMSDPAGLDLTSEALTGFAPGRFFRDAGAAINSLDFHRTEDLLVCAGTLPRRCWRERCASRVARA